MSIVHIGLRLHHVLDEQGKVCFEGTKAECEKFVEWQDHEEARATSIACAQIAHYLVEV